MTLGDFLEVIYANRDLLGELGEPVDPKDTYPFSPCKGCPLRAAMVCQLPIGFNYFLELFLGGKAVNPCPISASRTLDLDLFFTQALANAWDGYVYLDAEADDDWQKQFAGMLIGTSLRPAPLELTA